MTLKYTGILGCSLVLACSGAGGGGGGTDSGIDTSSGPGSATDSASASASASAGTDSGSATSGGSSAGTGGSGSDSDTTVTTSGGPKFDVGGTGGTSGGNQCEPDGGDATLSGTVWAPNGEIPVSGALVYTSKTPPAAIPQQVYCDDCQELPCDAEFVLTNPDGTFSLNTDSGADTYLVVRKGQFMRVSQVNINPGPTALADADTTLPDHNDPGAGLYIPLIAVGYGVYDRLEDALGKIGLGDTLISNMEETLVEGTEPFDIWDNDDFATHNFMSQGTFAELVSSPTNLDKYHIIFVPCSDESYSDVLTNPTVVQNIRDWVAKGGRWYVADWSNQWMHDVFPEYQTFYDDGFGTDLGSYDSLGDVLDQGLLDWLTALPAALKDINPLNDETHPTLGQLPKVMTVDNWSGIKTVNPVLVDDGMGGMVDVGHKVWLEGPGDGWDIPANEIHPLTVTGQFGCGKIQFTSYHTAEFFDYVGLSPQELVLLYTILEIGTCQEPLPPPEG